MSLDLIEIPEPELLFGYGQAADPAAAKGGAR